VFVPRLFTSYGVKLWDEPLAPEPLEPEPLEPEPWDSEVPEVPEVLLSLLDMITKICLRILMNELIQG
jgi:hypothetical protein